MPKTTSFYRADRVKRGSKGGKHGDASLSRESGDLLGALTPLKKNAEFRRLVQSSRGMLAGIGCGSKEFLRDKQAELEAEKR